MANNHQKRISLYFTMVAIVGAILTLVITLSANEEHVANETAKDDEAARAAMSTVIQLNQLQNAPMDLTRRSLASERPVKMVSLREVSPTSSADKKRKFLEREILDSLETFPDSDGRFERTEIIKTAYRYPYLRADQVWKVDPKTGQKELLSESFIVANQVVAKFDGSVAEDKIHALLEELGYKIVKKIPSNSTYLLDLGKNVSMSTIQEAKEALTNLGGALVVSENKIYSQ